MYTIYKIENVLNRKPYIGFTIEDDPQVRFKKHLKESKIYPNRHLYRAMRKDGVENFVFEILKQGEDSEWGLLVEEPYYIALYDSKRNGYNMTDGGDGSVGWKPTAETILHMRNAQLGKVHSPERRQRNSESRKGKRLSEDHCKAITAGLVGKKKSEKHCSALRAAMLGNKNKRKTLPSTIS